MLPFEELAFSYVPGDFLVFQYGRNCRENLTVNSNIPRGSWRSNRAKPTGIYLNGGPRRHLRKVTTQEEGSLSRQLDQGTKFGHESTISMPFNLAF
jgi:hypothetical protein